MTTYSEAKPAGTPTWIELTAPDVDAARRFYQAVLGWDYDIADPEYGGYDRSAGAPHDGWPGGAAARRSTNAGGMEPVFATTNVEADVARAVELGARVVAPAMVVGDFGAMAACEDPCGAAFSFWQAGQHVGAQVTEEPGSAAWCRAVRAECQAGA